MLPFILPFIALFFCTVAVVALLCSTPLWLGISWVQPQDLLQGLAILSFSLTIITPFLFLIMVSCVSRFFRVMANVHHWQMCKANHFIYSEFISILHHFDMWTEFYHTFHYFLMQIIALQCQVRIRWGNYCVYILKCSHNRIWNGWKLI